MGNYWTFRDINYLNYLDCWRDSTEEGSEFLTTEGNAKNKLKEALRNHSKMLKDRKIVEGSEEHKNSKEYKDLLNAQLELKKVFEDQAASFQTFFNKQYENIKHKDLQEYTEGMKNISEYDNPEFDFQAKFTTEEETQRRKLRLKLTSKMIQTAAKERYFYEMCLAYGKVYDTKVKSQEFNLFYIYDNKGLNYDTVIEAAKDRFILDQDNDPSQEHVDKIYNIFHKAIKTVDQESLDFLANKTEWTDEDIVENFELIDKISRLTSIREDLESQTRRSIDFRDPKDSQIHPRKSFSNTDPVLNQFFMLNEKALTKALELSNRAGFIQSMYYDKTEVKNPEINQFIKKDYKMDDEFMITDGTMNELFGNHDDERDKLTTNISGFVSRYKQNTEEFNSKTAGEKMDMWIHKGGLTDLYNNSFYSTSSALSENIMLIKNVFRASGSDMAAVKIKYTDDSKEQTITEGFFNAATQIQQDAILSMYSRVVNLNTNFTFVDEDNPEKSVAIPSDMLLDEKFAERLRNEITQENLYKEVPEPRKRFWFSDQTEYEKDLAFSKLANSYKKTMQKLDLERRTHVNKETLVDTTSFANIENAAKNIKEKENQRNEQRLNILKSVEQSLNNPENDYIKPDALKEKENEVNEYAKLDVLKDTDKIYNNLIKGKNKLGEFDVRRYRRAAELITDLAEFIKSDAVDAQMKKQLNLAAQATLTFENSQPGKCSSTELKQVANCIKNLDAYEKTLAEQSMQILDEKTEYQIAMRQDMVATLKEYFVEHLNDYKDLKEGKFKNNKQELQKTSTVTNNLS